MKTHKFHIQDVNGEIRDYKVTALCGEFIDMNERLSPTQFWEVMGRYNYCSNCACHPDFAILLLGDS